MTSPWSGRVWAFSSRLIVCRSTPMAWASWSDEHDALSRSATISAPRRRRRTYGLIKSSSCGSGARTRRLRGEAARA